MKKLFNQKGSALLQIMFVIIALAAIAQYSMQRQDVTLNAVKKDVRRTSYDNFVIGMRNLLAEPTSCYALLNGQDWINGDIIINTGYGEVPGPIGVGWVNSEEKIYIATPQLRFNTDIAAPIVGSCSNVDYETKFDCESNAATWTAERDYIRTGFHDSADPGYQVWKGAVRFKPMETHPVTGKSMYPLAYLKSQYVIDLVFYIDNSTVPGTIVNCFGEKSSANACTMTGGSYDSRDNAFFNSNVRCQPDLECWDSGQGIINNVGNCVTPYDSGFIVGYDAGFKYMCKWCNQNRAVVGPTPTPIPTPTPPPGSFAVTFVTDNPYPGDLGNTGGADTFCTSESLTKFPGNTAEWKAFIGTDTRRACTTPNCTSGATEHLDWVLEGLTEYRREDGVTVIATTNIEAMFDPDQDFVNAFITGPANALVWGGFMADGRNHSDNCQNFTFQNTPSAQIERFKAVADGNGPYVERFTAVADVANSSNLQGILLNDAVGTVAYWIDTDNSGSLEPAWAIAADRDVEITTINQDFTAAQVVNELNLAIGADPSFTTVLAGNDITITHVPIGNRAPGTDGDNFFTGGFTEISNPTSDRQGVIINDDVDSVAFWIDVDNSGSTIPPWALAADRAVKVSTIVSNELIGAMATKLAAAIDAEPKFSAVGNGGGLGPLSFDV
ncbi:MAG: DUF1554 domain-containing protein, partial [Bacteriovoracaceae bacterium]|nr:DUF1554 domain-containing protein [Bacteriovoracaceae bacterium]